MTSPAFGCWKGFQNVMLQDTRQAYLGKTKACKLPLLCLVAVLSTEKHGVEVSVVKWPNVVMFAIPFWLFLSVYCTISLFDYYHKSANRCKEEHIIGNRPSSFS